ncbi:MAG: helix-turn-helix transcriptional regulator [Sandaracinaceae bacterium]|nr:helix-turn-helix transcriptional regulator [Sandaracinaceae bacterium]
MTLTTDAVVKKSQLAQKSNGASHAPVGIDGVRLGQRIRELRLAAGLTQAELARRTGIHRPNIARVEAGRHTPSLETLARLASAIGVPTTAVLD